MTETEIAALLGAFQDGASVSPSLRAAVAFAVKQELVKGNAAGNLDPQASMSRIAAATVLIRAMLPRPFVLDANDSGTTIKVEVGDTIEVVLKGNPTTGYGWTVDLSEDDALILEQVGEPAYVADSDLIGVGGTYTFTFKALTAGEASLELVYARSWESVPPLETFSVTVQVEAASGGATAQALDGTAWKLEAWSVSSLDPADFEITAQFENGRISGKSAVNLYGGQYTADASGAFGVGMLISTLMAGSGPAMLAEAAYTGLLGQARSYAVDGDELTLLGEGGNELLIFGTASAD
jgi:inhibitor of cysteine peptidase